MSDETIIIIEEDAPITIVGDGASGPQGPAGPPGPPGADSTVPGPTGPAGPGVAMGGDTGQVLAKKSNADYDTEWVDAGEGGVTSVNSQTGDVSLGIADMNDVNAATPEQGDVWIYDQIAGKFVNRNMDYNDLVAGGNFNPDILSADSGNMSGTTFNPEIVLDSTTTGSWIVLRDRPTWVEGNPNEDAVRSYVFKVNVEGTGNKTASFELQAGVSSTISAMDLSYSKITHYNNAARSDFDVKLEVTNVSGVPHLVLSGKVGAAIGATHWTINSIYQGA